MFTVGPVQENCFLSPAEGPTTPSSSTPARRRRACCRRSNRPSLTLDAILLTHTHFDHVGAVAPLARATGAPVYCPKLEVPVLQDIMAFVPWPGFGPFESWDPEHTVQGGETLSLAGLRFDVVFTPGHSPGHVTYVVRDETGDVLRRRALPGLGRPRRPARRRLADARAPRSRRCSTPTTTTPSCIPATWASRRSAPSAPPTRSSQSCRSGERQRSRHRAARTTCCRRPRTRARRSRRRPGGCSRAPATGASRRRPSRTPSCSRAASASRPTSSRRRCTPSTTAASARSRCAPRAPRRSAAPTSSTACTSCPSR